MYNFISILDSRRYALCTYLGVFFRVDSTGLAIVWSGFMLRVWRYSTDVSICCVECWDTNFGKYIVYIETTVVIETGL